MKNMMPLTVKMMFSVVLCLALILAPRPSEAGLPMRKSAADETARRNSIDRVVRSYADLKLFNGNVLVAVKGKLVFAKSYGLADMEWNVPNSRNTKFRIGSVTKQFTAVLILQLCQEGKIDLQAKITDYLPWYRKDTGEKITVRHLLTHTSGIPNYTKRSDFAKSLSTEEHPPQEFAEKYCMGDLEFEPDTQFSYNNSGYYLLGVIIETVTKKPYAQVLKERITDVLGMKDTGIDTSDVLLKNRAAGYEYGLEGYFHAPFINMASSIFSAGAIYSTVDDLAVWQKALHGGKLLTRESQAVLFTPNRKNYGYGVYINQFTVQGTEVRKTGIGHPGGINGFSAFLARYVEDETDVILLDNTASVRRVNLDEISLGIYSALQGFPVTRPKQPIEVAITEKMKSGKVDVVAYYHDLKTNHAEQYDFAKSEVFLNNLGYLQLQKGRTKDAIAILRLGVEEYPASSNTHDSYAEALLKDGQRELAVKHYKRSLELNPNNTGAVAQLKILENK